MGTQGMQGSQNHTTTSLKCILKQIIHTKATQSLYCKLQYVKEKDTTQGVTSVITPNIQGEHINIHNPNEIHNIILQINQKVFEKVN